MMKSNPLSSASKPVKKSTLQGKNDPYAICSFGSTDWKPRTETKWDAGDEAKWVMNSTDKDWRVEVTKEALFSDSLKVSIMDANKMTKDTLIGQGEATLKCLAESGPGGDNQEIEISLKSDFSAALKGYAKITAHLEPYEDKTLAIKEITKQGSTNFTEAILCIRRIEALDMKNVEAKLSQLRGDHNDPYAILSFAANQWEGTNGESPRTSTLWDHGKYALWEISDCNKQWRIPVTKSLLLSETLTVTLMDENRKSSDVMIGKTSLSLLSVVENGIDGEMIEVEGILRSESSKPRGRVKISFSLISPNNTRNINNASYTKAYVCIDSIHTYNLSNVEGLGPITVKEKADPLYTEAKKKLEQSYKDDNLNFKLLVGCSLVPVLWGAMYFTKDHLISSLPKGIGKLVLNLTTITTSLFLLFTSHRALAYTMSYGLRTYFQNKYKSKDCWDLHFGWVSYRGLLDLNEWRFHNIIWRNPKNFTNTPFFMHTEDVTVTFDITTLLSAALLTSPLKIFNVTVNSPEVFIEKENNGEVLNVFAASGKPNRTGFVKTQINLILQNIKNKISLSNLKSNIKLKLKKDKIYDNNQIELLPLLITFDINNFYIFKTLIHLLDMVDRKHSDAKSNNDIYIRTAILEHEELTKDPVPPCIVRSGSTDDEIINIVAEKMVNICVREDMTHIVKLLGHIVYNS